MRNAYKIVVGNPEGKRQLERPRRRWEDNVKVYLNQFHMRVWIGFVWLMIMVQWRCCEHGNESLGSIIGGEYRSIDQLSDFQILKKNSAPVCFCLFKLRRSFA
jgi:hypothetical protein